MAVTFAFLLGITAFLTGNGIQANTVADNLETQFSIPTWVSGLVTSGVVAAVILGGISRIGRVTSVLAPVMAIVYVLGALIVIVMNIGDVGPTFALIFREAFNPTAGGCGDGGWSLPRHADVGCPPRPLLQRGGAGIGADRALGRQDGRAGLGRRRGAARALHRHDHHLHHDGAAGHHDRRVERPLRDRDHAERRRPLVPGRAGGRRLRGHVARRADPDRRRGPRRHGTRRPAGLVA